MARATSTGSRHKPVAVHRRRATPYRAVIEAASDTSGVDFAEDLEQAWRSVARTLEHHNELLELLGGWYRLEGLAALRLDIESFRPRQDVVDYVRERLGQKAGEDWWTNVATAMNRELEAASR